LTGAARLRQNAVRLNHYSIVETCRRDHGSLSHSTP